MPSFDITGKPIENGYKIEKSSYSIHTANENNDCCKTVIGVSALISLIVLIVKMTTYLVLQVFLASFASTSKPLI